MTKAPRAQGPRAIMRQRNGNSCSTGSADPDPDAKVVAVIASIAGAKAIIPGVAINNTRPIMKLAPRSSFIMLQAPGNLSCVYRSKGRCEIYLCLSVD